MDLDSYELWSSQVESRVVSMKRGHREILFTKVYNKMKDQQKNFSEHVFLPKYGYTVGQLAYYILSNSK